MLVLGPSYTRIDLEQKSAKEAQSAGGIRSCQSHWNLGKNLGIFVSQTRERAVY